MDGSVYSQFDTLTAECATYRRLPGRPKKRGHFVLWSVSLEIYQIDTKFSTNQSYFIVNVVT